MVDDRSTALDGFACSLLSIIGGSVVCSCSAVLCEAVGDLESRSVWQCVHTVMPVLLFSES
jgi:hypothetical protein